MPMWAGAPLCAMPMPMQMPLPYAKAVGEGKAGGEATSALPPFLLGQKHAHLVVSPMLSFPPPHFDRMGGGVIFGGDGCNIGSSTGTGGNAKRRHQAPLCGNHADGDDGNGSGSGSGSGSGGMPRRGLLTVYVRKAVDLAEPR